MIRSLHKSKQYWVTALKVFILLIAFGFIYQRLTHEDTLPLAEVVAYTQSQHMAPLYLFLALAVANWAFEIKKWQLLVNPWFKISFWTAAKQCLASLTASLATPNRIGEYGAKAYYFPSKARKKILLLNFFSHGSQMGITTLFGILGTALLVSQQTLSISGWKFSLLILITVLFIGFGIRYQKKELLLKGLTLENILRFYRQLKRTTQIQVWLLSLGRYLIFSSLFIFLLQYFGMDISYREAAPLVWTMYLLVSVIPSIFLFDVVVRGGTAVWLFSLSGYEQWPVLCTVLTLWILHFVLPAIWGGWFLLKTKPETT